MADFLDAVYWNRRGGWRGLTNLTAAVLLLKNRRAGAILGGIFGVTLMLWICIQFYMFPLNFMSTAYFIFGLIQTITGYVRILPPSRQHITMSVKIPGAWWSIFRVWDMQSAWLCRRLNTLARRYTR